MRVASRVLLSVGTVAAHVLVSFRLASGPGANSAPVATVPVVIAQRDFAEGDRIDRNTVLVALWPAGTVPAGAYSSIDQVAGLVTGTPVFRGEAIIPRRLAGFDGRVRDNVKITPGKRAMSFRVNDASAFPGVIQPNSRVDLLVVIEGGKRGKLAKVFMQDMRLLAIGVAPGQDADGRHIDAAVATIEVTPQEGEKLAIAMRQGKIQLILRNAADSSFAPYGDVVSTTRSFEGIERPHIPIPVQGPVAKPTPNSTTPLVRHAVIFR